MKITLYGKLKLVIINEPIVISNKNIFLLVRPYFRNEYKTRGIPLMAKTACDNPSVNRPVADKLVKKKVLTKTKENLCNMLTFSLNKECKNKYVKYIIKKIEITYSNLLIRT
jgi:hypothetical protein